VISDDEIDTPIPEEPNLMIIMNQPSMDFVPLLRGGGLLLYNSSLIDESSQRDDITKIAVPATEIADSLGKETPPASLSDVRSTRDTRFVYSVANSVMFGAYLGTAVGQSSKYLNETLEHFLAGKRPELLKLNQVAVGRGIAQVSTAATTKR
jgi:2-oxoglutarate ferredoxin oxidoreductase subunit gamma